MLGYSQDNIRMLIRIGPLVMWGPTLLWGLAWFFISKEENPSWYIVCPMFGFLAITALWHIGLVIFEKRRLTFLAYAILHLPLFCFGWLSALVWATRAPL
jgi:hypothetical protein